MPRVPSQAEEVGRETPCNRLHEDCESALPGAYGKDVTLRAIKEEKSARPTPQITHLRSLQATPNNIGNDDDGAANDKSSVRIERNWQ